MKNKTILFAEDEMHLQKLISTTLEENGYEVFNASDGEVALKIFEEK